MANRSLFDLSKDQNVFVEAAVGARRRRVYPANDNIHLQSKVLIATLTVVVCLLSSNCLSLARLNPNVKLNQQTWATPEDSQVFYATNDNHQERADIRGGHSQQANPTGTEFRVDLISNDGHLLGLDDLPNSYYVGSEPLVANLPDENIHPVSYNQYILAGQPLETAAAELEARESQQKLASINIQPNYPLQSSYNSDYSGRVVVDNADNDDLQTLEFKSKLADLVDLDEKLAQLSTNKYNLDDNINSYDNIEIANPVVNLPTLVESPEEQKQQQLRNIESRSTASDVEKAFTLLEDEGELLAANNHDKKHDKPTTTTAAYGTVVTGRTEGTEKTTEQQPASSMFKRMYKQIASYLPFLSQINILKNGQSQNKTAEDTDKRVQDEKSSLLAKLPVKNDNDESSSTKQSVSKSAGTSSSATGASVESRKETDDSSLLPSLDLLVPTNDQLLLASGDEIESPTESLIGKYVYTPLRKFTRNAKADEGDHLEPTTMATPVKKLNNEYRPISKLSHRVYSSRRLQHPEEDEVEAEELQADEPEELGYRAPARSHRPYYSHRRIVESEPLGSVSQQNKTNDLYFLIMVGSFCAMAVAVVLAAGLFAYRVQQNRKSTNETDYPTYGVVGPNNMTGGLGGAKLGAASFVGGYFNSNLGAGVPVGLCPVNGQLAASVGGAGKHDSAKQLADFYTISDSGILSSAPESSKSSASGGRRISADQQPPGYNQSANSKQPAATGQLAANDRYAVANCQDAARMYHYQNQKQQMIISDRNSGRHNSASDLDSEDENDDGSYTVYECPGLASAHEMEIKNPLFNDDQTP